MIIRSTISAVLFFCSILLLLGILFGDEDIPDSLEPRMHLGSGESLYLRALLRCSWIVRRNSLGLME